MKLRNPLLTIGNAFQMTGAALLASAHVWPPICYVLMLVGAACWLAHGLRTRDRHLITLNGFWLLLNVVGMVAWSRS